MAGKSQKRTLLTLRLINKWVIDQYHLLIGLLQQPFDRENIVAVFHKLICHLYRPFNRLELFKRHLSKVGFNHVCVVN